MTQKIRSYSELIKLNSFIERYNYLRLVGAVGRSSFGYDRYLNQALYKSRQWQRSRDLVIIRDESCDLGISDYLIFDRVVIHHMNPISVDDIEDGNSAIFDPEFLICTTPLTHQAIHYSDESLLPKPLVLRKSGDTTLWRR